MLRQIFDRQRRNTVRHARLGDTWHRLPEHGARAPRECLRQGRETMGTTPCTGEKQASCRHGTTVETDVVDDDVARDVVTDGIGTSEGAEARRGQTRAQFTEPTRPRGAHQRNAPVTVRGEAAAVAMFCGRSAGIDSVSGSASKD